MLGRARQVQGALLDGTRGDTISTSCRKVGQRATLVQASDASDQRLFAILSGLAILVQAINAVSNGFAGRHDFADDIALEGVPLNRAMPAQRFQNMLERPALRSLACQHQNLRKSGSIGLSKHVLIRPKAVQTSRQRPEITLNSPAGCLDIGTACPSGLIGVQFCLKIAAQRFTWGMSVKRLYANDVRVVGAA